MKCQCEHASHFDRTKRSPNGNPTHKYGQDFHQTVKVGTPWGKFEVCKDCAKDCLDEYCGGAEQYSEV